jgi:cell division transport system permease protein
MAKAYRTTRVASFSTVAGITLVLTLLGAMLVLFITAYSLTRHYQGQLTVQVYMNRDVEEREVLDLKKQIEGEAFSAEVSYLSPEEAAADFAKELGQDFVDVMGYNPLPASLDIKVDPEFNLDNIESAIENLKKDARVEDVIYQKGALQQLNENVRRWGFALGVFAALLLVIALALISNTITLAIFSQRFLIKSMQLVGATYGFIQRPFIWRGLKYGFVASLLALTLLAAVFYFFRDDLNLITKVLAENHHYLWVIGGVFSVGLLVSWLSTLFAVRRFIVLKQDKLY